MIDVMVLTLPERETWLQTCLDSMKDQPVQIHVVAGVEPDQFAFARQASYRLGSNDYLCHVDDDDYILTNTFDRIEAAFLEYPDVDFVQIGQVKLRNGQILHDRAFSGESILWERFNRRIPFASHLTVHRRAALTRWLPFMSQHGLNVDHWLHLEVKKQHRGLYLDQPGYVWRLHESQLHKIGIQ